MAIMAFVDYGADWVINNDADEFWWPLSGNLADTFRQIPPDANIVEVNRKDFVMLEETERNSSLSKNFGDVWRKLHSEYQKNDNLDEYCLQNSYDEHRLNRELANGNLIIDRRLDNYLGCMLAD